MLSLAHGDLTTRGIEPVLKLAPRPPLIHGDRVQLEQVMLNLMLNAAEAMAAQAGAERTLTVRTSGAAPWVHMSFTDRGPGFAAELIEKLFEPFYTTKPQGLGLGLSISRSIIRAHGGRLWGAATPGTAPPSTSICPPPERPMGPWSNYAPARGLIQSPSHVRSSPSWMTRSRSARR